MLLAWTLRRPRLRYWLCKVTLRRPRRGRLDSTIGTQDVSQTLPKGAQRSSEVTMHLHVQREGQQGGGVDLLVVDIHGGAVAVATTSTITNTMFIYTT